MTLVEVLAGLALLGALLTGLLVAAARLTRQDAAAEARAQAVKAADELLSLWWQKPQEFPRQDAGVVDGRRRLCWRTSSQRSQEFSALGCEVVRLEVLAGEHPGAAVLASVDVVLPKEQPATGVHAD